MYELIIFKLIYSVMFLGIKNVEVMFRKEAYQLRGVPTGFTKELTPVVFHADH